MKTISCGILIKNEFNELLMGHSTGNTFWDVPKGMLDNNESYIDCAIRECMEEISLDFTNKKDKLIDLGLFDYNAQKSLYLFLIDVKKDDINLNDLVCNSFFEHYKTKKLTPEVDDFGWVKIDTVNALCAKSMSKLLNKIFSENQSQNKVKP